MQLQNVITKLAEGGKISDFLIKEGEPLWVRLHGSMARVSDSGVVTREVVMEFLLALSEQTGVPAGTVSATLRTLVEHNGDRDFAVKIGPDRFRGNVYLTNNRRIAIALRQLKPKAPPLASLGLPPAFLEMMSNSKGLLLVTGATGSGKTTTLAAAIDHLNESGAGHIITLEDPMEYIIESNNCLVDQRQIGRDTTSFSDGLRAALREDPDTLMIGELRDPETISTALTAATTGHLVMGTLHTNSARQSVERLTSEFPAERREWVHNVLSNALLGIVSQVLVPKLDGTGRLLVAELMVASPDVRSAIRDGKTAGLFNIMDTGSSKGHVLLNSSLAKLVRNGSISTDAALAAAYDPNSLRKELNVGARNG